MHRCGSLLRWHVIGLPKSGWNLCGTRLSNLWVSEIFSWKRGSSRTLHCQHEESGSLGSHIRFFIVWLWLCCLTVTKERIISSSQGQGKVETNPVKTVVWYLPRCCPYCRRQAASFQNTGIVRLSFSFIFNSLTLKGLTQNMWLSITWNVAGLKWGVLQVYNTHQILRT